MLVAEKHRRAMPAAEKKREHRRYPDYTYESVMLFVGYYKQAGIIVALQTCFVAHFSLSLRKVGNFMEL
jgi:hypothetical protein